MPISASTLSALQKVGAAAFTADEKLKKEVGVYAQRVNTAIFSNPYHLGNDALIESWKVVARLSKTLAGIEEELRSLYRVASELVEDEQPSVRETRALAAPAPSAASTDTKPAAPKSTSQTVDLSATTVKVKTPAKKPTPKPAAVAAPAAKPAASTPPKALATKSSQGNKAPAKSQAAQKVVAPAAAPAKPAKKVPASPVKAAAAPAKAKPVAPAKKAATPSSVAPTPALICRPPSKRMLLSTSTRPRCTRQPVFRWARLVLPWRA